MTGRTTRALTILGAAVFIVVLALAAPAAHASWYLQDASDGSPVTTDPGATPTDPGDSAPDDSTPGDDVDDGDTDESSEDLVARYWALRSGGDTGTEAPNDDDGATPTPPDSPDTPDSGDEGGDTPPDPGDDEDAASPPDSGTTPPDSGDGQLGAAEQTLLDLINDERSSSGLTTLEVNSELTAVAQQRNNALAEYFAANGNLPPNHDLPELGRANETVRSAGIAYRGLGENMAASRDTRTAHQRLMASPGHQDNLLNSSWTQVALDVREIPGSTPGVVVIELFLNPR